MISQKLWWDVAGLKKKKILTYSQPAETLACWCCGNAAEFLPLGFAYPLNACHSSLSNCITSTPVCPTNLVIIPHSFQQICQGWGYNSVIDCCWVQSPAHAHTHTRQMGIICIWSKCALNPGRTWDGNSVGSFKCHCHLQPTLNNVQDPG
jgi:hypothetical protein